MSIPAPHPAPASQQSPLSETAWGAGTVARFGFVLVAAILLLYQCLSWCQVYAIDAHPQTLVRAPFTLAPSRTLLSVTDEAARAGIASGDRILRIDNQTLDSERAIRAFWDKSAPGAFVAVEYQHPEGQVRLARLRLESLDAHPASEREWIFALAALFLLPALCLSLGLGTVWSKPRALQSWFFLFLMVGYSQLCHLVGGSALGASFVLPFRQLATYTMGIWLVLLALRAPDQSRWDVRFFYATYLWLAPQIVLAAWLTFATLITQFSFRWSAALSAHLGAVRNALAVLMLLSLLVFLLRLVLAERKSVRANDRRRSRILLAGSLLSFTPISLLVIHGMVRGLDPLFGVNPSLMFAALAALGFFPLSLLYVLRVHHVLSLKSLALQGLLMARAAAARGLFLLFLLTSLACVVGLVTVGGERVLLRTTLAIGAVCLLLLASVSGGATRWLKEKLFPEALYTEQLLDVLEGENVRELDALLGGVTDRLSKAFSTSALAFVESPGDYVPIAFAGVSAPATTLFPAQAEVVAMLRQVPIPREMYGDSEDDWRRHLPHAEQDLLDSLGSALLLPLVRHGRLLGMLTLGTKPQDEPYTPSELDLLHRAANRTAIAVENSLLFASLEFEVAQRERQRAEQKAALEANAAKSDFLAKMSHELRTPLNAIIGYSELLGEIAEEENLPDFCDDLGKIRSAGRHLLGLINSILDISKIEAGRMELFLQTCDLHTLLEEVVDIIRPVISKNGNVLQIRSEGSLGAAELDATKLRQALLNLLSNATKFTRNGTVTLRSRRILLDTEERLEISVTDTGIGISPEKLDRLFQPFMQADNSIARDYGGTGLGLAISRHFCRMMDGELSVSSEIGVGSTFTVSLPLRSAMQDTAPAKPALRLESLLAQEAPAVLLVIDDDPRVHDMVRRYLAGDSYTIHSAYSGADGLAMARALQPDAITLDVFMPDIAGWQILIQLKSDPLLASIPVVMLTIADDRSTGFALGSQGYLLKPVSRIALNAALDQVLQGSGRPCSVLLVDDDSDSRKLIRSLLDTSGWSVAEAENGLQALASLEQNVPDLVLADLIMPIMDGFALLSEMRARPAFSSVPVIVITSKELSLAERGLLSTLAGKVVGKHEICRETLVSELRSAMPAKLSSGRV